MGIEDLYHMFMAHFPIIVMTLLFTLWGQVNKKWFFTHKMALQLGKVWAPLRYLTEFLRRTMPLHFPVLGAIMPHVIDGLPLSKGMVYSDSVAMVYYMGAGVLSIWTYDIVKTLAKKFGLAPSKADVKK